jgi:hypothetical protein
MASTFSPNLSIELIGTGDQAGTWGTTTNSNLGTLIEQAISGYVTQAVATGTDTTITIPNGSTGVARNMYIELTGTGGASTNLIVPANKKLYFIFNNSTGAVTVKVSGQTGVSVPTGKKMVLVSNGTDIVNGLNYIADFGTNSFSVTNLTASSATITNLIATSGSITNLVSSDASATVLRAGSATLTHLSATSASITNLALTSLTISSLSITNVSVASATVSSNLTLSGGTANGVLYLNGSKVATSGSALTFDGTQTLSLFATGNAVTNLEGSTTNNAILRFRNGTTGNLAGFYGNNSKELIFEANGATEQMRLTSTGLGIGTTSPASKVEAVGASAGSTVFTATANTSANTTDLYVFRRSDAAVSGAIRYNQSDAARPMVIGTTTAHPFDFMTNGSSVARLDTSGNLGLGVTPSAWGSGQKALQTPAGAIWNFNNANMTITQNAFSDGTEKYINNGFASKYNQNSGQHIWSTAASGTAGNAISFTQAMTLNASGNLGIGTSSPTGKLHISGNFIRVEQSGANDLYMGRASDLISGSPTGAAIRYDGTALRIGASSTEVATFSGGNLGIGTASPSEKLDVVGGGLGVGNGTIKTVVSYTTEGIVGTTSNHALLLYANNAERARITSGGDLLVGVTTGSYHILRKAVTNDGGNTTVEFQSTGGSTSQIWYGVSGFNANAANAATKVGRDATTLRSINAGGTVNASGADYAEYMTKAGEFALAKGDVCGIDADGKLTNVFANAISFVVKSTDPSYVGGDSWGANFKDDPEGLEAARQKVDRIAFAGQVPVNVLGATPGQYIVPINDNGAIKGVAVSNPTFEQYQSAVGKVIAVQDDGRALIIVKVA